VIASDEQTPVEKVKRRETNKILQDIAGKLSLSPEQRVVMNHLYGLSGATQMAGVEIADNFGTLTGKNPGKKVSRQRITQIEAAIEKKISEAMWNYLFANKQNPTRSIEQAIDLASDAPGGLAISSEERNLLMYVFGLFGAVQRPIEYIAGNYEILTGVDMPPMPVDPVKKVPWPLPQETWSLDNRKSLVNAKVAMAKTKLINAVLLDQ
jgi:hypothetical protein